MAKYLVKGSYAAAGAKGLLKEGGSKRHAAVRKMVEDLGGKLEAFYYAFGDADVFAIMEFPDAPTAAALSLAVNASGVVESSLTPLLTPDEIDQACKKTVKFRPPGA